MLHKFAKVARQRIRLPGGGYRRDHLRALAQRIEVAEGKIRIIGSKNDLLRTLVGGNIIGTAETGVPSFIPKWRRGRDSNPRTARAVSGFQDRRFRPLSHLSNAACVEASC